MNLVEPFGIDNGEVYGSDPESAFVLGVEWQLFRDALDKANGELEYELHLANVERCAAMAKRRRMRVEITPIDETWARLCATPLPRLVLVGPS
jgi:hypothetical protein